MKIRGKIADAVENALCGYRVAVYHGDVHLEKEKLLGRGETGQDGAYCVNLNLARYPLGVNVRVAVLDRRSKEIWSSPIHYNAKADLVVEATVPDANLGISEYQRLTDKLTPLLHGAKVSELQPKQIAYLVGRSGISQERLALFVAAAQLHQQMSAIPEEGFYGLLWEGLPETVRGLAALTKENWKAALEAALRANIIAPEFRRRSAAILAALSSQKAAESLRSSSFRSTLSPASFVTAAIQGSSKQKRIADLIARSDGVNGKFWKAMTRDRAITDAEGEKLRNYAAVSEVVGNDPQLLALVVAKLTKMGEKVAPAVLAKIKRSEWASLVAKAGSASSNKTLEALSAKERKTLVDSTIDAIADRVATGFPTETLKAELDAAPASGYFGQYKKDLVMVLDNNSGFDLRSGLYPVLRPARGADPIRRTSDKNAVRERVGTLARLYRALPETQTIAPGTPPSQQNGLFAKISMLAEKGYHSSSAIAAAPRARFIADVSAKPAEAAYWGQVYGRATAARDVAWLKGIEIVQRYRQPIAVIGGFDEVPADDGVADLRTLFGSLDMCDCEACSSVTSPAAYLADILNFLGTDVGSAQGKTPYDVLIERRPDIPHILLNCDNANRELPYIDLVNELLEDEVLRKNEINPVWMPYKNVRVDLQPTVLDEAATGDPLAAIAAKKQLVATLNKALSGYDFTSDIDVAVTSRDKKKSVGTEWLAFHRGWLVELSQYKKSNKIIVTDVSRQAYGTKAELAANPAFRNARATKILEQAKYPLSLPPGLPLIETRLFLSHLQVPRERLIKLLAPQEADGWAVEYLGLSEAEASLITTPVGDPQYVVPSEKWGFHSPNVTAADALVDPADSTKLLSGRWSDLLRRVDVLIARAGISYVELLDLLVTDFLNPVFPNGLRPITIQSTDANAPATCDLSKLRIEGRLGSRVGQNRIEQAAFPNQGDIGGPDDLLDRLVRFQRLKRRTGWSSRELDLAIRQVQPLVLDAVTLRSLAALRWVKSTLGLSHSEACALMGAIDTRRYIDHGADGQPTLSSQHEQLFLNRAVTNPIDDNFALDETNDELRNLGISLQEGKATIAAALEISEEDVTLIATGVQTLSIKGLSSIYRRALFAKGFALDAQELFWLEKLNGSLPGIDQTVEFVEMVTRFLRSNLSVTDAWFLLRDTDRFTAHLEPRDDEIVQNLAQLRDELQKIESQHRSPDLLDADGAVLRTRLGELNWGPPLIDDIVGTVADTKLFSLQLSSKLPDAVNALLNPGPDDPVGAPLASANSVPDGVEDLVGYDRDNNFLRPTRPLTRSDHKRLLLAPNANNSFRNAVELLFALGRLSYDPDTKVFACRGLLSAGGIARLNALDHSQVYQGAVAGLARLQKQFVTRKLRYCSLAQFEVELKLTAPFQLSPELAQYVPYIYHDSTRNMLVVRGQLTDAEVSEVSQAISLPPAAKHLFVQALAAVASGGAGVVNQTDLRDLLASAADVDALFDPAVSQNMPTTTAEIAGALLEKLTPCAREVLERKAVVGALSSAFGMETAVTQDLIERRLSSAGPGAGSMAEAFWEVIKSDARTPIDPAQYATLFDDYRRLSKIALLFQRLNVESRQLPWLFDYAAKGQWLDVRNLTSGAATAGATFSELSELARLFGAAANQPYNVDFVNAIFAIANGTADRLADVIRLINENTKWPAEDLASVCQELSLSTSADFLNAKALDDLRQALKATGQLGATAAEALALAGRTLDDGDAAVAKSLAKSKHDAGQWSRIVKPINDNLREIRRSALVVYLVANPRLDGGHALWRDADSLYEYELVDVQMSACMTTSRIRLALSSVQLFVQRCLMNLEAQVLVSDDPLVRRHWNEWEPWRKLYRVWEANRKVFLYTEDWIDPELRDDKTPFFDDLANELMQNEVTQETAEAAFLNYLGKLDQVGKLEVMGIFIQEEAAESDTVDSNGGVVVQSVISKRILHVVARTYGDPRQWFYRKLETSGEWHNGIWSPWVKIDADVTGDHVLPVVWNHHLYLFWALFEQKSDPQTQEELDNEDQAQEPKKRWYIKIAWSEFRQGRWSPKRVSQTPLKTPAVESESQSIAEADFSFKTDVTNSGITIKCYGPSFPDEPVPADGADSGPKAPAKDGYFLLSRDANFSIRFEDPYDNWLTDLNVLVYQGDRKILTLDTRNAGYVDVWDQFGTGGTQADSWRNSDVEIRTTQKLLIIDAPQWAPWNWVERSWGNFGKFDPLYVRAKVVDDFPAAPEPPPAVGISRSPGLIGTAPPTVSRIGRFDFQVCRGDLTPSIGLLSEAIPPLDASTSLRGMMYVEDEGAGSFLEDLLQTTLAGRYRVLLAHQNLFPDTQQPFFFQDDRHAYLVTMPKDQQTSFKSSSGGDVRATLNGSAGSKKYRFDVFYHPYVCDFITRINRKGLDELLTLQAQASDDKGATFRSAYAPDTTRVEMSKLDRDGAAVSITREYVDFEISGSYSIYNWELFFHAPLLIATRLTTNQRFEEAQGWLRFIFDPTTRPGAFSPATKKKATQRFWNVRPFWEAEGRVIHSIDDLLRGAEDLSEQYAAWREDPFKPFILARLRQTAFMQSVVMRYLDNLIAWADQQFSYFTMESTNEATLLYVLAAQILGPAPEKIPPRAVPALQTYLSLQQQASNPTSGAFSSAWQNFSELMVEVETYVAPAAVPSATATSSGLGRMWAFCVPSNANLLEYWPRVAGRLFNLRHCRDIEGVERKIPLWDPPIDPGLLVRAAAAGLDLASVLADVNSALPNYRFNVMLQKALELCNDVKAFGAALLAALEKKDAEALAQLRSQQEVELLTAVRTVRENQVQESTALREAAERSKTTVEERRNHYRDIAFLIPPEVAGMTFAGLALTQEVIAGVSDALAAIAALVPQYIAGTSGFYSSPVVTAAAGGEQISRAASASASLARSTGTAFASMSSASHTFASFQRRQEEWKLQETLASKELDQIEKQITAATIREAIAQAELSNHDRQIDNSKAIDEYLRGKYTNRELYGWLQSQLSSLYFQAYKLAFDTAKKAERGFRSELGLDDSNFVQFGYWDSLKSGLLAGDRLQNDLRRMEAAYLDRNRREFEITKHVSLLGLNPAALVALKAAGECEVDIPEWLFDMDYPGQYMRRIKALGLSIPCVVGRYTAVNCTLTQSFSRIRKDPDAADSDFADSNHFHENFGSAQTIVTSTAREDSGLFELNFRDDRYLPFEGTGAISRWRIQLPRDTNQFDVSTVSDVILHIRYTARQGSEGLRDAAKGRIPNSGIRLFDIKAEFGTEWYRFLNPESGQTPTLTLPLKDEHFPFHSSDTTVFIQSIGLLAVVDSKAAAQLPLNVKLRDTAPFSLGAGSGPGSLRSQEKKISGRLNNIVISGTMADVAKIEMLLVVCRYELKPSAQQ